MAWTRAQYEGSLEDWQEKEARYRRNWRSKKTGDPRRFFWFKLLKNAVRMVDRRQEQLAKLAPTGVSDRGIALIKEFEGFRGRRYKDPVGVWTIGYGETRGIGPSTLPWTEKKAAAALKRRVNADYYPAVRNAAKAGGVTLRQNQVDALSSFAYNLGAAIFSGGTTIGGRLRQGNLSGVANAIPMYDKAGGKALPGLTKRRAKERALFLS